MEVKIKNLDKILKNLNNAPKIIQDEGNRVIGLTLITVEAKAKPITPIDTGRLRSSYQTHLRHLAGILNVATDYAVFVHEGTRFMKGRPFLKQGVQASMGKINQYWKELGDRIVKDLAR